MTIFIAALSSPIENPNNDLMKRQDQASCSQLAASVVGDTYYLNCTLAS
ncbi:29480_t:CDS:1, partial [Gigaspora margarita]